jgi:uncharacterized membrane protein HdeD (DUF308 family)
MDTDVAANWWVIVVRGVAAILFAMFALLWRPAAIATLAILFGAYSLVDGILNFVVAFRGPHGSERRGPFGLCGIVGVGAGLVTFFWSGLTGVALLMLVAFWSVVSGSVHIVAGIRRSKSITRESVLAIAGVLSLAFGALTFLRPVAGAIGFAIWIGVFALIYGALLVTAGFRLRAWERSRRQQSARWRFDPRHA